MNAKLDDPKLTAYALGEPLPEADRRVFERLVAESLEARALVDNVRALGEGLRAEYDAQRTTAPSRELTNIIEFSEPHRVVAKTRSVAQLLRVAALVVASLAIASVAWYATRSGGPDRVASVQPASAAARATDPGGYIEMEIDGPAGGAPLATTGYENVRRLLTSNQLPPKGAVRIEEMVNHFPYRYAGPAANARDPLAVHLEVASAPWKSEHRLVRIGLKGREISPGERSAGADDRIAKGVKIAVEFNPAHVAAYRFIGYENKPWQKPNSRPDRMDAGSFRAGQAVTALYEIIPAQTPSPAISGDSLPEILTVKVNYQNSDGESCAVAPRPLTDDGRSFETASSDFKFAAAVASFAMLLCDSPERGDASLAQVARWAQAGRGDDPAGDRAGFSELVRKAESLLAAGKTGSS